MQSTLRGFLYTTSLSCLLAGASIETYAATTMPLAPLDLNRATAEQLTTLKGIGNKRAQAIVTYRQAHGAFHEIKELAKVPGMSSAATDRLLQKNPDRLVLGKI